MALRGKSWLSGLCALILAGSSSCSLSVQYQEETGNSLAGKKDYFQYGLWCAERNFCPEAKSSFEESAGVSSRPELLQANLALAQCYLLSAEERYFSSRYPGSLSEQEYFRIASDCELAQIYLEQSFSAAASSATAAEQKYNALVREIDFFCRGVVERAREKRSIDDKRPLPGEVTNPEI